MVAMIPAGKIYALTQTEAIELDRQRGKCGLATCHTTQLNLLVAWH